MVVSSRIPHSSPKTIRAPPRIYPQPRLSPYKNGPLREQKITNIEIYEPVIMKGKKMVIFESACEWKIRKRAQILCDIKFDSRISLLLSNQRWDNLRFFFGGGVVFGLAPYCFKYFMVIRKKVFLFSFVFHPAECPRWKNHGSATVVLKEWRYFTNTTMISRYNSS